MSSEHPEILQRAVREGHEIGNHSWSHPALARCGTRACVPSCKDRRRDPDGDRRSPGLDAAALWLDHRATEKWINSEFGYRIDPLGR